MHTRGYVIDRGGLIMIEIISPIDKGDQSSAFEAFEGFIYARFPHKWEMISDQSVSKILSTLWQE
jgi:hypothetical protein